MRRKAATALLLACLAGGVPGCALVRYGDYFLPAMRADSPTNVPLPAHCRPPENTAFACSSERFPADHTRYPSVYHIHVDTAAPGAQEGDYTIGIAFSGGGTRGTVFAASCVDLLRRLGDVHMEQGSNSSRLDIWQEADYVSGVSTGAIPAAAFVLNASETCPPSLRFPQWPDCFNVDLVHAGLRGLVRRPDRLLRDMTIGMNTRPGLSSVISEVFFGGSLHHVGSGLTFGDLPSRPVLLLGATMIQDPGAEFIQTRLPYRFSLPTDTTTPWAVGFQTFETFHTDPMPYSLGEACYNSISFPGNMRSGLMRVYPDPDWVYSGLEGKALEAMRRARNQPGLQGIYELKDGGLIENGGVLPLARLFSEGGVNSTRRPLLIAFDAGYRDLRPVEAGGASLTKGWFQELHASVKTGWQAGQTAYDEWFETQEAAGQYDLVRVQLSAFTRTFGDPESAEGELLARYCAEAPGIGDPLELLDCLRGIGTNIDALSPREMAAIQVAARFAARAAAADLLAWAAASGAAVHWANLPL